MKLRRGSPLLSPYGGPRGPARGMVTRIMQSVLLTILATPLFLASQGLASSAQDRGLAIVQEMDRRDEGFSDTTASMRMTLIDRRGRESVRHLRLKILEVSGDGDKSLSVFDRPHDIQGTAMLTFSHPTSADEQWMYFPAAKRVKRIASRNKSGPFMGSEFAFEDLGSQEVEKYTYRWLHDESIDGMAAFVVERKPAYHYSGYTRQVAWIDKAEYRPLKIDYYDRKNTLLKTQTFSNYHRYLDRYWRAHTMSMVNHQTGKKTQLSWENITFRSGLSAQDFTHNSLRRAR